MTTNLGSWREVCRKNSNRTSHSRAASRKPTSHFCALRTRSSSDIAERMITRDPDITRLLDRLQKRGLVERSRGKQDRRVIYGKITAAGLNLLREMDSPLRKFGREILRHVSQANLKLLIDLLEQVRGGAGTPFGSLRAGSGGQTS